MELEPIAFFRSPFTSKFGIPRQSSIIEGLHGTVELAGSYRNADGLRGLEGYDYLWLIWGFSANRDAVKHFTVRPPRLGGNRHVGVWATRSSFRPNNLGLSSVRILSVDKEYCKIDVDGADLMDGTPIFDIKPCRQPPGNTQRIYRQQRMETAKSGTTHITENTFHAGASLSSRTGIVARPTPPLPY